MSPPVPLFFRYSCKNRKILTFFFLNLFESVLFSPVRAIGSLISTYAVKWQTVVWRADGLGTFTSLSINIIKKKRDLRTSLLFFEIECKSFPKPWWSWYESTSRVRVLVSTCVWDYFSYFSDHLCFFLSRPRVMVDGSFGFSYKQRW